MAFSLEENEIDLQKKGRILLIKLVLMDLDNTLLPFQSYWEEANKDVFHSSHLTKNLDYHKFLSLFKRYDKELWNLHSQNVISLDELRQQRLIKTLNDFQMDITVEESQQYFQEFFQNLLDRIAPDFTLHHLLTSIKSHYELAILTNGKKSEQKEKIKRMGLDQIIKPTHIFISEEIGYEKPDPKAFYYVLDKLNKNREEAIYVGDSWLNDIEGSVKAGLKAVWIHPSSTLPDPSYHSKVYICPSILELEEVLQTIQIPN